MDIKTFINVASNLPPEIAVLSKGPTGIGKSAIVHQIGKSLNMEVIDRRLSYMTEGDLIGLPELVDGVTRFAPIDWFIRACNEPIVIFFDELNRATIEVQQCAFQIVLDRELNGHKLHPETRIFAAINEGNDYQVTEMDPALLRRFYSVDLEPTVDDWLNWATSKGEISDLMVNYIKKYPAHLRHEGPMTPGKVYPNPASWARLDRSLKYAGIDIDSDDAYNPITSPMCLGFIGTETSTSFVSFIKNHKKTYGPEDVLKSYPKNKKKIDKISNDKKNDILNQIATYISKNEISLKEAKNIFDFAKNDSDEMCVSFYYQVLSIETENNNVALENVKKITKYFSSKVVSVYNNSLGNEG
jgi:ribosomal protein S17E